MFKRRCLICEGSFYVKPSHVKLGWGKFCSTACRSRSQLKGKSFKCYICRKAIYRSKTSINRSKSGKFFCGKSCQTLWRNSFFVEDKHSNWVDGISIYKKLLKNDKIPKCLLCNLEDERVLIVHHKDHNRHNNKLPNLTWLCYNCHRLVHIDSDLDRRVKTLINVVGVAQLV